MYCSSESSDFERVQSALAWLTVSHSGASPSFAPSFAIRIGSEMWSEYLRTIERSRHPDSSSPWSVASSSSARFSRRCSVMRVPRSARSIGSTLNSPLPSDSQRTPSAADSPARRDSTTTRSATMNDE